MAAVSVSAAALSSALPELDLLSNFENLILKENYEEAEKLLSSSELRRMFLVESGYQFIEELLENKKFLIIIELVKVFSKHEVYNKYCELCQVIAMTWLGDPAGYFRLQKLILKPDYLTYVESVKMGYEHAPAKAELYVFFDYLWGDIDFVQNNPLLFAVLKKLQDEALEVTDISSLITTEGAETALQQCIQLFADFMGPEQMGGLCQHLLDQINYFREHGTLMPKADPAESDKKV